MEKEPFNSIFNLKMTLESRLNQNHVVKWLAQRQAFTFLKTWGLGRATQHFSSYLKQQMLESKKTSKIQNPSFRVTQQIWDMWSVHDT
jgi:hypothetical protein